MTGMQKTLRAAMEVYLITTMMPRKCPKGRDRCRRKRGQHLSQQACKKHCSQGCGQSLHGQHQEMRSKAQHQGGFGKFLKSFLRLTRQTSMLVVGPTSVHLTSGSYQIAKTGVCVYIYIYIIHYIFINIYY